MIKVQKATEPLSTLDRPIVVGADGDHVVEAFAPDGARRTPRYGAARRVAICVSHVNNGFTVRGLVSWCLGLHVSLLGKLGGTSAYRAQGDSLPSCRAPHRAEPCPGSRTYPRTQIRGS